MKMSETQYRLLVEIVAESVIRQRRKKEGKRAENDDKQND